MLRAWRLAGQSTLQRLSGRVSGGPAACRFLTTAGPGHGSAPRATFWDKWGSMLFGQGRNEMPQQGDGVGRSAAAADEPHKAELHMLVQASELSKAHALFDSLLDRGEVNESHLGTMLRACYTSTELWKLASRVEEAGVPITAFTYNQLIYVLLIEGRADEVEALQRLMVERGVEPNKHTAAVLARPQLRLSKKRLWALARLVKAGELRLAWELFDGLLSRGHADEYLLTAMLKACPSSDAQQALVKRAEEAGVKTAAPTFTFLLSSLRVEGRNEEAEELQREMARRGIVPNEYTAKVLARSDAALSKQRTAELGRLLKAGEANRAWELFDGLLERGHADVVQYNLMLNQCATSAERLTLEKRAKPRQLR